VTGAGGFVGSHCVAELLSQGYRVVGTVRRAETGNALRGWLAGHAEVDDRLSFVEADLLSDRGWTEAAKSCRYVMHVASPYPIRQPSRAEVVVTPARDGTLRVLAAARAAGVERVVLTSSVAAIAAARPDKTDFNESDWSDAASPQIRAYDLSKTLAERAAWEDVKRAGGPDLVVINPGQIFGPLWGASAGTSSSIILSLLGGRFPVVARFGFPIADVRDVAEAHVAALRAPAAVGERIIVADGFVWLIDMARALADAFPQYASKMPRRELPNGLARLLSRFVPQLKAVRYDIGRLWQTSGNKCERLLGVRPRPGREAVTAMAESLIAAGAAR